MHVRDRDRADTPITLSCTAVASTASCICWVLHPLQRQQAGLPLCYLLGSLNHHVCSHLHPQRLQKPSIASRLPELFPVYIPVCTPIKWTLAGLFDNGCTTKGLGSLDATDGFWMRMAAVFICQKLCLTVEPQYMACTLIVVPPSLPASLDGTGSP